MVIFLFVLAVHLSDFIKYAYRLLLVDVVRADLSQRVANIHIRQFKNMVSVTVYGWE